MTDETQQVETTDLERAQVQVFDALSHLQTREDALFVLLSTAAVLIDAADEPKKETGTWCAKLRDLVETMGKIDEDVS